MRRLTAPAVLVLAAALVIAPVFGASAVPAIRGRPFAADPPPITWSVEPTDADGDDDRASLAYAVDPGTQITDYVAVSNFGDTVNTFDLYATDATNDFETGGFGLLPAARRADRCRCVDHDRRTRRVTVRARRARAVIPFTLLVPSDATPGDHTAGVIASFTTESTDAEGQAINLEQRVAARVYLRVSGDPVAAVEATGLVAGFAPSWNPFGGRRRDSRLRRHQHRQRPRRCRAGDQLSPDRSASSTRPCTPDASSTSFRASPPTCTSTSPTCPRCFCCGAS